MLSQRYEDATGEEMRIPVHLKSLEETLLNTRRSQLALKSDSKMRRSHDTPLQSHIMERVVDEHMEMESPSLSTAQHTPRHIEKSVGIRTPRTPITDFTLPSRKGYSTPRPRTPQLDPPLPPPPPPTIAPPFVGPPPAAFIPHIPPSPAPPFHSGVAYPPPPPYSALPLGGSASFPPSYPHMSVAASMPNLSFCGDEMTATSQPPLLPPETSRGKRDSRSRPSRKKKKKKRRTKYISREREGLEKTIVEEIKTVTKKKKYRVTESKRSDIKSSGLQMISSDESVENAGGAEADEEKNKKGSATGKGAEKDKKFEVHRWSSSSTDSDGEQFHKKEKRRFMRNVGIVREATEKVIGEEIVDVITKDFYKRIESAQEALRAQAQIVTQEKPSDVSQLCSPLAASLNATPEKLGSFPFTINMPKLPSFRRVSKYSELKVETKLCRKYGHRLRNLSPRKVPLAEGVASILTFRMILKVLMLPRKGLFLRVNFPLMKLSRVEANHHSRAQTSLAGMLDCGFYGIKYSVIV
ncbi:hypothetical protein TELCIR_01982 [Teladorsagia circumcincta]|uniref:Uncharacterized protein n=1 Tax=Teladorsagia circumcincta TaxID=45464 RepID=A0A2G9V2H7_TELCI|nr:hypothetical protein TELCIR_01982 [Teladorsagia circumcincta]